MLKIKRNNLIALMHDQGKTVKQIADELKISENHVYRIIKKKNTPSVSLAKSIANFFEKDIDDVFEFENE